MAASNPCMLFLGEIDKRTKTKPQTLSLSPGEGMDVYKCIVPLQHGGTINSHRAESPLLRLVEGKERWEASDHRQGVPPPKNWGGTEQNHTITFMVLKAKANVRRTSISSPRGISWALI
ncbi:uncharacterized protein TNCV_4606851 [Trichonephila clavipes]|nr:uncharacterized protein TNCV_4606851 [Trichonephila clavipes]